MKPEQLTYFPPMILDEVPHAFIDEKLLEDYNAPIHVLAIKLFGHTTTCHNIAKPGSSRESN